MNDLLQRSADPVLGSLADQPADPLLAIVRQFRADPWTDKLDLGIGVYRDDTGACPIPAAVKEAERRLLADQQSKGYLGAEGDLRFVEKVARLVLGDVDMAGERLFGVQTPGGGGALRLGADLYRRAGPMAACGSARRPGRTTRPSWRRRACRWPGCRSMIRSRGRSGSRR